MEEAKHKKRYFDNMNGLSGKIKVYTFMCLDLPHAGHIRFLREAKKLGEYLIVGILTDDTIISYKREPIMNFTERVWIAESIRYIDTVVEQEGLDPTYLLKSFKPDILCHGDDWTDILGSEWMKANGKEVKFIPYYPYQSTSKIINKILQMDK